MRYLMQYPEEMKITVRKINELKDSLRMLISVYSHIQSGDHIHSIYRDAIEKQEKELLSLQELLIEQKDEFPEYFI